jgi:hypothetical protein
LDVPTGHQPLQVSGVSVQVSGKLGQLEKRLFSFCKRVKKNVKRVSRALDFVRWQGASRFKNGAYTLVLEYFKVA